MKQNLVKNFEAQPHVAAILVNYNGYEDTIECVESLRRSRHKNMSIFVVDNASTNDSLVHLQKLTEYPEVILIASEVNGGFSAGNNIGMRAALESGAEYMLIINNDTVVEAGFLDAMLQVFNQNSQAGCVISKILYESEPTKIWYAGGTFNPWFCRAGHMHYNQQDNQPQIVEQSTSEVEFASGCCMLLSKEAVESVGYMDEDYFLYVEDTEYSLRLKKAGYELVYEPAAVIYHKVSASTKAGSDLSQYYTIRNTLHLGKTYLNTYQRATTFLFNLAFYTHKVITGQYRLKNIIAAQIDFYAGRLGRSHRF